MIYDAPGGTGADDTAVRGRACVFYAAISTRGRNMVAFVVDYGVLFIACRAGVDVSASA